MPDYTVGWVYNLHDRRAHSDAGTLIAIAVAFPTIALLSCLLRLWLRWRVTQLGPDDLASVASLILGIGYSAVAILQTRWGQALDPAYFPPENLKQFSLIQYTGGPIYCLAILGFKLSLLYFYLRLIGQAHNKNYKRIVYVFIALVTCNQIIFACLLSFACEPIRKQWDPTVTWGHCIDQLASYYALGGTSFGFDIIILILPFPAIARLNLNHTKKIYLTALFALGFFVSIIQIIRIFTIKNLKHYTDSKTIVIWSIVEINLGVLVSCIPAYGALFRKAVEWRSTYKNQRSKSGNSAASSSKGRDAHAPASHHTSWLHRQMSSNDDDADDAVFDGRRGVYSAIATTGPPVHDPSKKKSGSDTDSELRHITTTKDVSVELGRMSSADSGVQ